MRTSTFAFDIAYSSYYESLQKHYLAKGKTLEIGGGAHPSIIDRKGLDYTIVDPDKTELHKAPKDITPINSTVQLLDESIKYDLIISKMVLEHVEDPDGFHKKVLNLLTDEGKAIHFFACRHSLPALVNRLLPEFVGDAVLRLLKNRDLSSEPKYEAYYQKTKSHTSKQLAYFTNLGYSVKTYHSFVGHKYFKRIPILNAIERGYTQLLFRMNIHRLATVALVVLEKNR